MPKVTKLFLTFLLLWHFEPPAPGVMVLPTTSGCQNLPMVPLEWQTLKTDSVSVSCQVCGDLLRPGQVEQRTRENGDDTRDNIEGHERPHRSDVTQAFVKMCWRGVHVLGVLGLGVIRPVFNVTGDSLKAQTGHSVCSVCKGPSTLFDMFDILQGWGHVIGP